MGPEYAYSDPTVDPFHLLECTLQHVRVQARTGDLRVESERGRRSDAPPRRRTPTARRGTPAIGGGGRTGSTAGRPGRRRPAVRPAGITEHGQAPTVQEIGEAVGLRSHSSVHYQLLELEAKHAIRRERGRCRGIRLT
ncbi:hypothetical protein [Streptomyces sp. NPDC040750]|uniref:LexA family protein n=1 Tax=Streptomyces sp. NPDC040750 TaxID=3154491 RepID=UPI0033CB2CA9